MPDGTYAANSQRVAKAKEIVVRLLGEMDTYDAAGVLAEIGLAECFQWTKDDFTKEEQARLQFTDLQMIAAAAALASANEILLSNAIQVLD